MQERPLTYASAGVDVEAAERAVRGFSARVAATHDSRVLAGLGGFGGMFAAEFPGVAEPVLVSSVDGVGTKTRVAAMAGEYGQLGADIVHHCVNDILCQGAKPLFFLDYFGCARLDPVVLDLVVGSAAEACSGVGCALVGGETAEMPGVYSDGEFDIVGTIVGVVDRSRRLPRQKASAGDALIGLASSGLHTNGFTLARRALFEVGGLSVRDEPEALGEPVASALLRAHKCYLGSVGPLVDEEDGLLGIAHITGGGLEGNVVRAVPTSLQAIIETTAWSPPPIFRLIQEAGDISRNEMYRAFNMGVGMVLVVARDRAPEVLARLAEAGESAAEIGTLRNGPHDVQLV
jgi:phosphoribosylformylglycinamidine cyclo-ligase